MDIFKVSSALTFQKLQKKLRRNSFLIFRSGLFKFKWQSKYSGSQPVQNINQTMIYWSCFFSFALMFKSKMDFFKVIKSLQFFIFMLKSKKPLLLSSQKAQKEQRASYTNCLSIIKPCHWSSTLRENIALKYINNCKQCKQFIIIWTVLMWRTWLSEGYFLRENYPKI